MAYFLSLFILNPSGEFAVQKLFFLSHLNIKISAIWSTSRVCDNWIC